MTLSFGEKKERVRHFRPIDDGSDIAELMQCFLKEQVDNQKFPRLSSRVKFLKNSEGGVDTMCEIMEGYIKEEIEKMILSALRRGKSPASVADYFDVPLEKVLEIQKKLVVNV